VHRIGTKFLQLAVWDITTPCAYMSRKKKHKTAQEGGLELRPMPFSSVSNNDYKIYIISGKYGKPYPLCFNT